MTTFSVLYFSFAVLFLVYQTYEWPKLFSMSKNRRDLLRSVEMFLRLSKRLPPPTAETLPVTREEMEELCRTIRAGLPKGAGYVLIVLGDDRNVSAALAPPAAAEDLLDQFKRLGGKARRNDHLPN